VKEDMNKEEEKIKMSLIFLCDIRMFTFQEMITPRNFLFPDNLCLTGTFRILTEAVYCTNCRLVGSLFNDTISATQNAGQWTGKD
jgi:hypothetical protein